MRCVYFFQTLKTQKVTVCLSFALLVAGLLPQGAYAQVLYGSVVGNVADASGGAVPKATVTVTNQGTGVTTTETTSVAGEYLSLIHI